MTSARFEMELQTLSQNLFVNSVDDYSWLYTLIVSRNSTQDLSYETASPELLNYNLV